jgi:alpha-L-arabinofuranosidase
MLYLLGLGLLFLAGFGGNAKPTWAQTSTGPTNISIGTTVQTPNVKRLGINMSGQSYYDSGQMMRNLTYANSGFEGETWQSILKCKVASGHTCADGDNYAQWPANFMKGATFEFIYGQAKGQTGTVVSSTTNNYAGGTGPTYDFGTATPAVGDVFILRQANPPVVAPDAGWWPQTSGGATITAETTDLSPNTLGHQAISLNASGAGQTAGETSYFDTFSGRSFVQLNGTYTMYFRAKSTGGSKNLSINVTRIGTVHGNAVYLNKTVTLTNSWQDYSYTFTANEDGTYVNPVSVSWSISGGSMYLDDAYLEEAAAPDNPTAYRNAVVDRLRQLNPGVIRYMDNGSDFGSSIDNMLLPEGARVRTGYGEGNTVSTGVPVGLEDFLVLCQTVGAEPWFTMPAGMSTTEMQNLLEFLNGSSSTPYGAKRAAYGQTAPWTSVFPTIHLELGNETWNVIAFNGEMFGDPYSYGSRVNTIFTAAKAAPSYNSAKIDLVADGWAVVPWWNGNVLTLANGTVDTIDVAPYTFNSLVDYGSNEAIYGPMFAQPESVDSIPSGYMYQQMQTAAAAKKPAKLAVYEVNLSTDQGTAPQATVDAVVPSVGAGISVAEHMLLMMRDDGVVTQNMFALPEYTNGFTNSNGGNESVKLWGTVVDMGGQTNLCRPQFLAVQLANTAIFGNLLATQQTGNNPTWSVTSKNDNISMTGAHFIQSIAFSDGTHNSVVVFNLSRTQALPVTFSGANAPTGTVQVGQLTSANLTDTNETKGTVATTNSSISNFNASKGVTLPPFSMTVYTWTPNGSNPPPASANTTTSLTATPTTVTSGQNVSLQATVAATNGSATPTGNVTFYDGSTSLGTTALSNGQVSLNVSTLSTGTHSLTAAYAGTSTDNASTSTPVSVTVNTSTPTAVATTTTLQAPSSVTVGQSVTLTAKVSPASGSTPTGTVNFMIGQLVLGSGTLSGGTASYTGTVALTPGQYAVVASYAGSTTDNASTSAATNVTVNAAAAIATTTTLQAPASVTQGQSITLTAKVSPASGSTPTGSVTFTLGSTTLGTAQLNGGTATYTGTVNSAAGQYAAVATYAGNSSDSASTSASDSVTVTQAVAATTTTISASNTKITNGQKVTVNIAVKAASGATPTGSVSLYIGSYLVTTLQLSNGQASYTATLSMEAGAYQLIAKYSGSSIDNPSSSAPLNFTVTATTAVNLTSGATQVTEGSPVALTASVVPQFGTGTATGAVSFYLGQTAIGTQQLAAGVATASLQINLPPGQYPLTAVYAGDTNDEGATSNTLTLTVVAPVTPAISTNTTLTATPTQLTQGQTMQLAATVTAASGAAPTGSISFYLGQTQIGSTNLAAGTGSSATASASVSATMAPGTYQLTAVYAGTSQDSASSSAPVTITIAPSVVATTTTLVSSASQLTQGQSFTLTATVAGSDSVVPQGNVNFFLGQTQLGSAALAGGQAVWTGAASFAPGTYTVTAVYSGNTQDSTSTSSPVLLVINPATVAPTIFSTNTVLAINPPQITAGQTLTLSVQVGEVGGTALPTGSVAFYLGQTQISTAVLANGQASWTGAASFAPGTYQVTAVYGGDATDTTSTSTPVALTVNAAIVSPTTFSTDTTLTATPNPVISGQSMTLGVQVAEVSGSSTPTGSVTFFLGQTQVGTAMLANGSASVSMLAPAAGTYSMTASYAGMGEDLASQSQPVTVTVQPATNAVPPPVLNPSFTLGLSSNSVSLTKAQSASMQVLLSAVQGYQGPVQLSCSGLPAGVTCNFSPATVSLQASNANSTLSLSTASTTSAKSAMMTNVTWAMLLPWDLVGLIGVFSRYRNKSRLVTLGFLLLVVTGGLVTMTGCGLTVNSMTQPYQVSVTAVGANQQSQTQSFTLYVTAPAANF